ncbi:unnamed protein product [Leptosia nina]|uniref:HTH CENPB-type domain-containing protein n=1 Tax=Leptosia nina TaxID=320188 RepID=A0AAV1JIU1_9NEOP
MASAIAKLQGLRQKIQGKEQHHECRTLQINMPPPTNVDIEFRNLSMNVSMGITNSNKMVRNYKRKTDRGKWNEEDMRRAVNAVLTHRMGFLLASATYDVPKSTLERRVRKARETVNADTDSDNDCGKKHLGRFKTVFSAEQENELAEYVKSMEARLFGLTGKELRIIAYQLAQRNHIDNPFNTETGMAGEDWLSGFLKRHPDLAYRRPEPTSAARAMAFNRVAVDNFFTLLENVIDKHKLTPERIYNVDETGISTVPKSQSKILSTKGQKQVGCLYQQREPLDVSFMRPLSTYYSAEVKKWLRDHPGRVVTPYQVAKLFGQAYLKAATMLTAINGFRKCGVWPLDKNVFTDADFIAAETTNTENLAKERLNVENAPSTQTPAITEENLSRPSPSVHLGQIDKGSIPEPLISSENAVHPVLSTEKEDIVEPATSFSNNNGAQVSFNSQIDISKDKTPERQIKRKTSFLISPENIMAIPKEVRTQERKTRKRGKTAVLTESPYKNELIKHISIKEGKNKKKTDNQVTEKGKKQIRKPGKKTAKKIKKTTDKENLQKKRQTKRCKNETGSEDSSSQEEDDDCACIYCGYLYSDSTEGWVICGACHGWAHNSCAGVDEEDEEAHICERCLPD